MEEFTSALNNLTTLLIVIGGSLFTLCLAAGAILYMTAAGDPQKQQLARGALLSSIIGVVILAMAPIAPRVISRFVIEPSGGQGLDRVGQASCDRTLRSSLITQRGISTTARVNSMIRQIQAQRRNDCSTETWAPSVDTAKVGDSAQANACLFNKAPAATESYGTIGSTLVPRSLGSAASQDSDGIARDSEGNILVLFATGSRPTDGSLCWMYLANADIWDQTAAKPAS